MTIDGTSPATVAQVAAAPPRPPARERDLLEGLLAATVFPEVKQHRDRIIVILRVINNTQAGREVLHDFGTLAGRGKFPTIEILQEGAASLTQSATRKQSLLLTRDALTAGAREIGVSPEVEQAPLVLFRLAEIRNVLAADLNGGHFQNSVSDVIDVIDVPLDPLLVRARFRKELQAPQGAQSSSEVVGANMEKGPPLATPPGHRRFSQDNRFNEVERMRRDSDSGPGKTDRTPLLDVPPNKASTVSNPYRPVTEDAATPVETPQTGKMWRAFQWVQQTIRAFVNFALRRREPSGDSGGNPAIGPSTSSRNAERPILTGGRPSHRRNPSIRNKTVVDPELGGGSAAPKS